MPPSAKWWERTVDLSKPLGEPRTFATLGKKKQELAALETSQEVSQQACEADRRRLRAEIEQLEDSLRREAQEDSDDDD